MDWTNLGLRKNVLAWLEATAASRYARERRLDPFATSMRDFDDVSPNLQAIEAGKKLAVNDERQRLTDLRGAGLVDTSGANLTALGLATLKAWEKYGVATAVKSDELLRHLLLNIEAENAGDAAYKGYRKYWGELRTFFAGDDLIDNWDALYTLNYLDWEHGGFAPGTAYRDETTPVQDIEVDLADYARSQNASAEVVAAAESVESAIQGKIPRGRHRATFCMALELLESGGQALPTVVSRFGFPKKPRSWEPFDAQMEPRLRQILADYKIGPQQSASASASATAAAPSAPATPSVAAPASGHTMPVVSAPPVAAMSLPDNYDYSSALVAAPSPPAKAKTTGHVAKPPKKVDHIKKATKDDAVGKLGEEFALQFERWRLRNHPDLLGKIEHVSKTDDTLGYDILSFETNGAPRLVEVKSTVGPIETRFFISANEVACAQANAATYLILRVGDLPDHPKCCEIRHPFDATVELIPATYSVTFKSSGGTD